MAILAQVRSRVDRFAGLSDRAVPVNLTRIESPDLLNCEFAGRSLSKRPGYARLHSNQMRDASARLDGVNDYLQIGHLAAYTPVSPQGLYVGIGCVIRDIPTAVATLVSKGYGTVANREWNIAYNPTAGTGSAGAWIASLWDATAGALRTMTLDDPATPSLIGSYRYLELYRSADTVHTFRFWDTTPAIVQTTTSAFTTVGAYSTSAQDITIGVGMSGAASIGTDFLSCSTAELRVTADTIANIAANNLCSTGNAWAVSELPDTVWTTFDGYWRINDGTANGTIQDRATANNTGLVPANHPEWISDPALVLGQSGLRFHGQLSFVDVIDQGANFTSIFASATGFNRWSVRAIYAPQLAPNETTVRAQTIIWAGSNATVPAPVAIYVNASEQLVGLYDDNGTPRTLTITATESGIPVMRYLAANGKRCRFSFRRVGAGNGSLALDIGYLVGNVWTIKTATPVNTTNASSGACSSNWAIARHVTSFTIPFTYGTNAIDGPMFGVIDDVQLVYSNSFAGIIGLGQLGSSGNPQSGPYGPFFESADWSGINPNQQVRLYMRFNEGYGNSTATGTSNFTAIIYPEVNDGLRWDIGLVECYRAPETQLIFDYKRILTTGDFKQSKLAISGCTLYDIDEATALANPVGAGFFKGGKWTAAQYGQRLFFACSNGQRPLKYDGGNVDLLGIAAPLAAPVVTVSNTVPGAFLAGTYYVYYTFRNSRSGVESNPSPGVAVTFVGGAGTDTISAVQMLLSSDPQVDQRRIYVGALGGAIGGTAFLAAGGEVNDNSTTSYTTAIPTPPVTGTQLIFVGRDEAPQASIVEVFEDFLFVGGNAVNPTRIYRSAVGSPDYFYQSVLYTDLDLDSGDTVTAMQAGNRQLFVSMTDGSAVIWSTGDSAAPIGKEILSRDHGAVGPAAFINSKNIIYYVAERDFWRTNTNAATDENVSSPENQNFPSIQQTMRTQFEPTRRDMVVCAYNSEKDQIWAAFTKTGGTRNDRVLVYDTAQAIWSLYDLTLDYVMSVEDSTGDNELWGAIEGFICKLDTGTKDGPFLRDGTISATTSGRTVSVTWNGVVNTNELRWTRVFVYRIGTQDVVTGLVYTNSATQLFLYDNLVVNTGDLVAIGGIPWFADFLFDSGDPLALKKLKWLRVTGDTEALSVLRQSFRLDLPGRQTTFQFATEAHQSWATTTKYLLTSVGGLGRTVRLRIGDSGYISQSSTAPFPSTKDAVANIYELDMVAEVVDVP